LFAVISAGEKFLAGAGVETYLSIEGLVKYLDIAEKTVRKRVLSRDIPYHKIMKVIRLAEQIAKLQTILEKLDFKIANYGTAVLEVEKKLVW
jgi:hypothetical protein